MPSAFEPTPTKARKAPKRRKFFFMSDVRTKNPAGVVLDNEERLLPPNQKVFCLRDVRVRGFPQFPETPRFRYDKRQGRMPGDLEQFSDYWLVSDHAKQVFEATDPEAFVFVLCDFILADGSAGPRLWLCDVIRVLDALDEERSDIRIDYYPDRKVYNLMGTTAVVIKDDAVGSSHIFRMTYSTPFVICDDYMKAVCKEARLKNVYFREACRPS